MEETISGSLATGGYFCVTSEPCDDIQEVFPHGFAGKVDAVDFNFGEDFAAQFRVFEFDPDEFTNAIAKNGHARCHNANLSAGAGITDKICETAGDVLWLEPEDE